MKAVFFNDDNLSENQIQDDVLKARAIIINDDNELLLSCCAGLYLLPGGRIKSHENIEDGLLREVKEETGIELDSDCIEPFLSIEQIIKNYPCRGQQDTLSTRRNSTKYYIVHTNQNVNEQKMNLTKHERAAGFKTIKINLEKILPLVRKNKNNSIRFKYFSRELKIIIEELESYLDTSRKRIRV